MIITKELEYDVLTAAKQRLINIFKQNKCILNFSGGKDSIVLADIIYNLIIQGKINKDNLIVIFIDEEAMYDDVIELTKKWRIKFIEIGVKFEWYAMQYKHFNCLNTLTDEETFICWDETKKDVWVRKKPTFAIEHHELFCERKENYQSFISRYRLTYGYISLTGVRAAESVQRRENLASSNSGITGNNTYKPLYDWKDSDIWLYILKYNIEIPKTYENLYRIGNPINKLRISQFFSIDTAKSLVSLNEMYPDLMERVIKREPNAYLCSLYWDTEMFRRATQKGKKLNISNEVVDYKRKVFQIINNPLPNFNENQLYLCKRFKKILIKFMFVKKIPYQKIYNCIMAGDPKERTLRAIINTIVSQFAEEAKNG